MMAFSAELHDKNSTTSKEFYKFLYSNKFTSLSVRYPISSRTVATIYDIILFSNDTLSLDIKYKVGYLLLSSESKGRDESLINFYNLMDYKIWAKIIVDIIQKTNKLPLYYHAPAYEYYDGIRFYIPLSYAIMKYPDVFKSIPLGDAVIDYYSVYGMIRTEDMYYDKAVEALGIAKEYDDVVKGYYHKLFKGTAKPIKNADRYFPLLEKFRNQGDSSYEAYQDILTVVTCNKLKSGWVLYNRLGDSLDIDGLDGIIHAYSNIHHRVPEGILDNDGSILYKFRESVSECIVTYPDKVTNLLVPAVLSYYKPGAFADDKVVNYDDRYFKKASNIVEQAYNTIKISDNTFIDTCVKSDAVYSDDAKLSIKYQYTTFGQEFIKMCKADDYEEARMIRCLIAQLYNEKVAYDTTYYSKSHTKAGFRVVTEYMSLLNKPIDLNAPYADLLVRLVSLYVINNTISQSNLKTLKTFYHSVKSDVWYVSLAAAKVLHDNTAAINLYKTFFDTIIKIITNGIVLVNAAKNSGVINLFNDDWTGGKFVSEDEMGYITNDTIYAKIESNKNEINVTLLYGDVTIFMSYMNTGDRIKCIISHKHANIDTSIITSENTLRQWFNNAMLYSIKYAAIQ